MRIEEFAEIAFDLLVDHLEDELLAVGAVENSLAIAVDAFALLVHHLVVLEQVLADFEVPLFHLFLGTFDAAADNAAGDGLAFLDAQPGPDVLDPFAGEDPHQVVFERKVEAAAAGVALASAAAAQLQVDAAGFVPLGADDVQAAELANFLALDLHFFAGFDLLDQRRPFLLGHVEARLVFVLQQGPGHDFGIAAEDDIGAAAGHVGGDGDGALAPGLGHDLGLTLVMLGVEHLVRMPRFSRSDESRSLFSIETVPTSTGRPLRSMWLILSRGMISRCFAALAQLQLDRVVGLVRDLAESFPCGRSARRRPSG